MPLFTVSSTKTGINAVEPKTFADLSILEEKHFQEMFRTHADLEDVLGEPLFVLDNEYNLWKNGARREIDLLALDSDGNIVVIELKCTRDGGHMDLQSLRYAAMVSRMTFSQAVSTHQAYLRKHGHPPEEAENAEVRIREFLGRIDGDVTLSDKPRVFLISQGFSTEIVTTVLWLIQCGLDISCFTAEPYQVGEQILLSISRLLPVASIDIEMPGDLSDTTTAINVVKSKRRNSNTVPFLEQNKILNVGDVVHLVANLRPNLPVESVLESERRAVYQGGGKFEWHGRSYSISMLCRVICEAHDLNVDNIAFSGPSHWAKEGETQSLWLKMNEILAHPASEND